MEDGNAARNLDDQTASATPSTPKPKPEIAKPSTSEKAPYLRLVRKVNEIQDATSQRITNTTGKLDEIMQRALRFEDPGKPDDALLRHIPYAIADATDALALTPARRIWEVTNSIGSGARAAYRTITRLFFHSLNTLRRPLKYLANPTRVATSTINTVANIANAIPASTDEVVNRGIKRPLERLENVPLVGGILSKIGKAAGWIARGPRKITGWFQKIAQKADSWIASKQ